MPADTKPSKTRTSASRNDALKGDAAARLVLAQTQRNPVRVARVMQAEIDRLHGLLEESGAPADAVILTGDDAKHWAAYQALGKPEDLTKALAKTKDLESQVTQRDARDNRVKLFRDGAKLFGWNETAATKAAEQLNGLTVELRESEFTEKGANGAETKVKKMAPHVITGEGAAQKAERLDAVIMRDHDLLLPALTQAEKTTQQPSTNAASTMRYPTQTSGNAGTTAAKPAGVAAASSYMSSRYGPPKKSE